MKHFNLFIGALLMLASFVAGGVFFSDYSNSFAPTQNILPSFGQSTFDTQELESVHNFLENNYLYEEEINDIEDVELGAIKGMVDSLDDPYTVYFSPAEYQAFDENLSGQFEGIGAEIAIREDQLVIVSPLEGTPADQAGLLPRDKVLAIDGEATTGITVEEAVTQIRGEEGTEVVLTIKRENSSTPFDVSITRGVIDVPNITVEKKDGVGIVSIRQYREDTSQELDRELADLVSEGMNDIVLDLRFNPGGYLEAAVRTVDLFVDRGEIIVSEQGRDGKVLDTFTAKAPAKYKDLNLVVLVNQGSASASEITAGALRDLNQVTLIGEQTFGKGVVQQMKSFSDESVLKYTVAEWLTPNGDTINEEGLTPDIVVEMTEEDYENERDPQLDRAITEVKK